MASPGDTAEARQTVERTITSWNSGRSRDAEVVLMSRWWGMDAVPDLRADGQSVLNGQLVDDADIVIALFHSRLGAPTARAPSGTAEEIERAVDRGIPVHVYFAEMPYPYGIDVVELQRLRTFRLSLQQRGLYGTYASTDELAAKARTALEHDVAQFASASPSTDVRDVGQPRRYPGASPPVPHGPHRGIDHPTDSGTSGGKRRLQRALGHNTREYRRAKGATQEAFAALIGVQRSYLGRIENGTHNITLASVAQLADRIGVTPFELLRDRPDDAP